MVEPVNDLPTFGVGHSLGSVIHLLIGSRYAVQRSGNILMAFNNKEASLAVPLFSPVIVPMAQSFGPIFSQLTSYPTLRFGVKSYYGISRNLLIKFKDDQIDETSILAQVLSSESAISSLLDMSIRSLPGDHGLPLQQVLPDVPPAMADAVNRGGELLTNLATGTPWEAVAKEVGTGGAQYCTVLSANLQFSFTRNVHLVATEDGYFIRLLQQQQQQQLILSHMGSTYPDIKYCMCV
uniref:OSJNBa0042I15.2 protein n=1 Tax=Oryza sativa subsp. japonica TaxID=39947 RepID=Q7X839_ORYSJ|nr:OSJNBa0042I15.2 [Oryza sativa Japonica Group]